ncbi:hypothetical protein J2848_004273 [Azospirillum lipoferum]|uniref:Uncharacterized protein n=1 Tax=Azospirillum lipoferum TaxID=193 RepID=A0A5A9GI40_AZOLI|nr:MULTISPECIES: hypothetical protein [Azospirillum]KAA0594090.1 hypothetical protein FZ942_21945 [Azospirillum lipoferum]MCP1612582.1 hypothetical protein [Azospirillum lipoferum]MDW5531635.1 hypothetical protein [Azospirillum sp. NL1]
MRTLILAAAAVLALSSPALAQTAQSQNGQGGWGGALDQLNRAVNPNAYPQDRNDRAAEDRDLNRDGRRYEGSSGNRRNSAYSDYSDRDLRSQYDRLGEEQRQIRQNRRAIEDEMDRRGINR